MQDQITLFNQTMELNQLYVTSQLKHITTNMNATFRSMIDAISEKHVIKIGKKNWNFNTATSDLSTIASDFSAIKSDQDNIKDDVANCLRLEIDTVWNDVSINIDNLRIEFQNTKTYLSIDINVLEKTNLKLESNVNLMKHDPANNPTSKNLWLFLDKRYNEFEVDNLQLFYCHNIVKTQQQFILLMHYF